MLASFLSGEYLLHLPYISWIHLFVIGGGGGGGEGSLTHPMLASSFFNLGSFSYTSDAGFFSFFLFFLSGEFLLRISC